MASKRRTPRNKTPRTANRLWVHRKKMGYTQEQVATLLGHRSSAHVSDYERGVRLPSLETAIKLELILCAPVAFLYRGLRQELAVELSDARKQLDNPQHD